MLKITNRTIDGGKCVYTRGKKNKKRICTYDNQNLLSVLGFCGTNIFCRSHTGMSDCHVENLPCFLKTLDCRTGEEKGSYKRKGGIKYGGWNGGSSFSETFFGSESFQERSGGKIVSKGIIIICWLADENRWVEASIPFRYAVSMRIVPLTESTCLCYVYELCGIFNARTGKIGENKNKLRGFLAESRNIVGAISDHEVIIPNGCDLIVYDIEKECKVYVVTPPIKFSFHDLQMIGKDRRMLLLKNGYDLILYDTQNSYLDILGHWKGIEHSSFLGFEQNWVIALYKDMVKMMYHHNPVVVTIPFEYSLEKQIKTKDQLDPKRDTFENEQITVCGDGNNEETTTTRTRGTIFTSSGRNMMMNYQSCNSIYEIKTRKELDGRRLVAITTEKLIHIFNLDYSGLPERCHQLLLQNEEREKTKKKRNNYPQNISCPNEKTISEMKQKMGMYESKIGSLEGTISDQIRKMRNLGSDLEEIKKLNIILRTEVDDLKSRPQVIQKAERRSSENSSLEKKYEDHIDKFHRDSYNITTSSITPKMMIKSNSNNNNNKEEEGEETAITPYYCFINEKFKFRFEFSIISGPGTLISPAPAIDFKSDLQISMNDIPLKLGHDDDGDDENGEIEIKLGNQSIEFDVKFTEMGTNELKIQFRNARTSFSVDVESSKICEEKCRLDFYRGEEQPDKSFIRMIKSPREQKQQDIIFSSSDHIQVILSFFNENGVPLKYEHVKYFELGAKIKKEGGNRWMREVLSRRFDICVKGESDLNEKGEFLVCSIGENKLENGCFVIVVQEDEFRLRKKIIIQ